MGVERIFITGGTGLVGTALSDAFSAGNFKLNATYRTRRTNDSNINWIKNDFKNRDFDFYENLANVDVIVHNAAVIKEGKNQSELDELASVNVEFTRRLLNAASSFDIKKIIFTSSFSFIRKPLPEIITENSAQEVNSAYAESKYIGEQLLQEHAEKYNVNYNICRISSPISFDLDVMPDNVIKKWIMQSKAKVPITVYGNGQRRQDFVSVLDIAQAYLSCIDNGNVNGIFNIAAGNTLSMLELATLITRHFGNEYSCVGQDENESDKWNISIDKAREYLNYIPIYSSESVVTKLLNSVKL